jgi:hypothetical protein
MEQNGHIIPEDRARITKIQELLIERYVEQKEALVEDNRCRALELEFEIKELLHEKEIKQWAAVGSAEAMNPDGRCIQVGTGLAPVVLALNLLCAEDRHVDIRRTRSRQRRHTGSADGTLFAAGQGAVGNKCRTHG